MGTIFDVPPKKNPGAPPKDVVLQPTTIALSVREYSDIFWSNEAKLKPRDRADIVFQLDRLYVYQRLGALAGFLVLGVGGSIAAKRYFPRNVMSLTAFSSVFGFTLGSEFGYDGAYKRALRDFERRPQCKTVIRLIGYRPTLSLWINYYSNGKPDEPFSAWWNRTDDISSIGEYGDSMIQDKEDEFYDDERFKSSPSLPPSQPATTSGWSIPAKHNPGSDDRRLELSPRDDNGQEQFDRWRDDEFESPEKFEKDMELERAGEDQPDDFSVSERKYSRSRYD
ncbi:hypothetical protein V1512DRAFT_248105 [Lipomyces arxii]|uniref:uncharacterized protein n=1 Tax=Lipomyces arxii TaxID=56418 RepID=UPI0034CEFCB3